MSFIQPSLTHVSEYVDDKVPYMTNKQEFEYICNLPQRDNNKTHHWQVS